MELAIIIGKTGYKLKVCKALYSTCLNIHHTKVWKLENWYHLWEKFVENGHFSYKIRSLMTSKNGNDYFLCMFYRNLKQWSTYLVTQWHMMWAQETGSYVKTMVNGAWANLLIHFVLLDHLSFTRIVCQVLKNGFAKLETKYHLQCFIVRNCRMVPSFVQVVNQDK